MSEPDAPTEASTEAPAETRPNNRSVRFRKSADTPKLSKEQAARESAVIRLAVEKLGPQGAQAFLNDTDRTQGRPLSVAIASAEGALEIEHLIKTMS